MELVLTRSWFDARCLAGTSLVCMVKCLAVHRYSEQSQPQNTLCSLSLLRYLYLSAFCSGQECHGILFCTDSLTDPVFVLLRLRLLRPMVSIPRSQWMNSCLDIALVPYRQLMRMRSSKNRASNSSV